MPQDMLTDITLSHIPELSDISLHIPKNNNDTLVDTTVRTAEPDYTADYNLLADDTTGFDLLRRTAYEDYEEGEGASFATIPPTSLRPRQAFPLYSPSQSCLALEDRSQFVQRSHLISSRDKPPLTLGDLTPVAKVKLGREPVLSDNQENGGYIPPSAQRCVRNRARSPLKHSPLKLRAHVNPSPCKESPRKKLIQPNPVTVLKLDSHPGVSSANMEQLWMDIDTLGGNAGDEVEVEHALQVDETEEHVATGFKMHTGNGSDTVEGETGNSAAVEINSVTGDTYDDVTTWNETDRQDHPTPSSNELSPAGPTSMPSEHEPHCQPSRLKLQIRPTAKQPVRRV